MFDTRTPLGRGRAWLRLALMQKKLSDYMKTIINRKDLLRCVWIVIFTEAKTLCEKMNVVSLVDHCSHNICQLEVQSLIITNDYNLSGNCIKLLQKAKTPQI